MKDKPLFPRAHLWLILPFVITLTGFGFYWINFFSSPFRQHVHAFSATAWFILVIIQPYLYQKGNLRLHRRLGLLGLFIAGALVFSGLQILPYSLTNGTPTEIANGIIYLSFIQLSGFSFSVYMAIRHSRNTPVHARWLITTVFWPLLPALARLVMRVIPAITGIVLTESFTTTVHLSHSLILLAVFIMMMIDYKKEKKVYASYIFLSAAIIMMSLTYAYFSTAPWWGEFLQGLLKQ